MGARKKVSNEILIKSYKKHNSVWLVAKEVGLCGQSVHERLKKLGKVNKLNKLSLEEKAEIERVYLSGIKRGDGKLQALSKKINRTIPFISRYAGSLGLTTYSRSVANKKHAQDTITNHPLLPIYYMMINRCHNPQNKSFGKYGERGIIVCERWRKSFLAFINDMGERPSKDYSIDRINNDGPYSPENCRWANAIQQANNKTKNVTLAVDNEEMTMAQASRKYSINYGTLLSRLKVGLSHERACKDPILKRGEKHRDLHS